jgi:hypothetical protein
MNGRERSLHVLVEKWLGHEGAKSARVTRFSHSARKRWRYVCVETLRSAGAFSIVFFRHDDGSWCVFPPSSQRPTMGIAHRLQDPAANSLGSAANDADAFA